MTTLWLEHHQPVPSQCKKGGPMVKVLTKGVVWWNGENDLFSIFSQGLFQEMFCWDSIFTQIQIINDWGHLMHIREVGKEKPKTLPIGIGGKGSQHNQTNQDLLWNGQWKREKVLGMVGCSGGQVANKLVDSSKEVFKAEKSGWVSNRGKREKSHRISLV